MGEQVQFGRFLLQKRLAIGGMAEVFLGQMPGPRGFEKQVVIKRILPDFANDPKYVDMFLDEARIVACFNHPNVIQVYELVEIEGQYCLVMEFLEGNDLSRVIDIAQKNDKTIPITVAAQAVTEAADGLHYVHGLKAPDGEPLNIIHRDVSPNNIIATRHAGIKVVDFGIAKHERSETRTAKGVIKGKLSYMAPETLRAKPVDGRADIFSLGAVLYELLTQTSCFHRSTPFDTAEAICSGSYTPARELRPDLPEDIDDIVTRMLAPDPRDRYENAGLVATELRQLMARRMMPGASIMSSFLEELFSDRDKTRRFSTVGNDVEVPVDDLFSDPNIEVPESTRVLLIETANAEQLRAHEEVTKVLRPETTEVSPSPTPTTPSRHQRTEDTVRVAPTEEEDLGPTQFDIPAPADGFTLKGSSSFSPPARPPRDQRVVLVLVFGAVVLFGAAIAGVRHCTRPQKTTVRAVMLPIEEPVQPAPVQPRPEPTVSTPVPRPMPTEVAAPAPAPPRVTKRPTTRPAKKKRKAVKPGQISLTTEPPVSVLINGRRLGVTPIRTELAPGTYDLELRKPDLGIGKTITVQIRSGAQTKKRVTFGKGQAIIRVQPWAHVFIHGRKVGTTPLPPVNLYEGSHDITLVNPELNARRTIRVKIQAGKTVGVTENL